VESEVDLVVARQIEKVSEEEYLEQELQAKHRHEYWNGTIVAMAGSTIAHNQVLRNLTRFLAPALARSNCEQYFTDTRLYSEECKTYFYPDSQIVCGTANYRNVEAETLLNPTIIIEVLSKSTEAVDRGDKFECYRTIASLQTYILIDQYSCAIDAHARLDDDTWRETFLRGQDANLEIGSCGVSVPLAAIYERVKFKAAGKVR
jgi:Uma2 family endonuclease